jgi:hypothetical protein
MADTVLQHMNAQNRPFNAQNIADALGRHGIKKGLAQKHLDTLHNDGKINCKVRGLHVLDELKSVDPVSMLVHSATVGVSRVYATRSSTPPQLLVA